MPRALAIAAFPLLVAIAACSDSDQPAHDPMRDGFTEITLELSREGKVVTVEPAAVKRALAAGGVDVFGVEPIDGPAVVVRTALARHGATAQEAAVVALREHYGAAIEKAQWGGNRIYVRTDTAMTVADVQPLLAPLGFELTSVDFRPSDDAVIRGDVSITVAGPEVRCQRLIEAGLGVTARIVSAASVGPQRPRHRGVN